MEPVAELVSGIERYSTGEDVPRDVRIWAAGTLAEAAVRRKDAASAWQHLIRGVAVTTDRWYLFQLNAHAMDGFFGLPGAFLALKEVGGIPAGVDATGVWKRAIGGLGVFCNGFPIGRPRYLLYRGLSAWLDGRQGAAQKAWNASLKAAEALKMPYEQGLAAFEIGRHLAVDVPQRRVHLDAAGRRFSELGAFYDLRRVEEALGGQDG